MSTFIIFAVIIAFIVLLFTHTHIVAAPFAWLLLTLYDFFDNYGIAIILFALVANLIMVPLNIKNRLSSMRTKRVQPLLDKLKEECGTDTEKYNKEAEKIYAEAKVNPLSGCLWTAVSFPILIALYSIIRQPMSVMMRMSEESIATVQKLLENLGAFDINSLTSRQMAYLEIFLTQSAHENFSAVQAVAPNFKDIDFSFLGLNLGLVPNWKIWQFDFSNSETLLASFGLMLIPIFAAVIPVIIGKIFSILNEKKAKKNGIEVPPSKTNGIAGLIGPAFTLWLCFVMPAAMGLYWIARSIFGTIINILIVKYCNKKISNEDKENKVISSALDS